MAPFVSSYTEAILNCLFQCPPLFFEPLEDSLATEMEAVVVLIGRGALDLYLDISGIYIFLLIGVLECCFGFERPRFPIEQRCYKIVGHLYLYAVFDCRQSTDDTGKESLD